VQAQGQNQPQPYAYERLSRIKDDDALSMTAQHDDNEKRARELGLTITRHHNDEGVSAFLEDAAEDRVGYLELWDAIRAGKVSHVFAWRQDRLWRNTIDQGLFLRDCRKHGVQAIITAGKVIDPNNPDDKMVATIIGAVDEHESDVKQLRIKRKQATLRAHGKVTNPLVALGWLGTRHGHERNDGATIYEPEAALIRDAATRVLAGTTITEIAREWNTNEVPMPLAANRAAKEGKPYVHEARWMPGHIKRILTNPRNAGHQTHNGEVIKHDVWPAILDGDTYERLVAKFERTKRVRTNHRAGAWTGVVRCAGTMPDGSLCGATMRYSPAGGNSPAVFACKLYEGRVNICGHNGVTAHHIERIAHEWLVAYADGRELEGMVLSTEDAERELHEAIKTEREYLGEWLTMLKAHEINRAQYVELCADTERNVAKLTDELARYGNRDAFAPYVGNGALLAELFANDALTPAEHRAVFLATGQYVWLRPAVGRGRFDPERVSIGTEPKEVGRMAA